MPQPPILLSEALPAIIRGRSGRASRRFIEFFTASIRNRNTRAADARAVKQLILTMRSGPVLIFSFGLTSTVFDRSSFRALKVFHLQFLPPAAARY